MLTKKNLMLIYLKKNKTFVNKVYIISNIKILNRKNVNKKLTKKS